jgi:hypothetical protein
MDRPVNPQLLAKRLRFYVGRALGLTSTFERWQQENPDKGFSDFFGETAKRKLAKGGAAPSLGSNLSTGLFGESGKKSFETLIRHGLKSTDTLVDYGCGTLRIGIHAIKYLQPGCYWGLDVEQSLLDEGRTLIGETLWEEKQPNLRVISPASVRDAAGTSPAMLLSSKVLSHVHPRELPEYFGNVLQLIGLSGQAIILSRWSEGKTTRVTPLSWAHSLTDIRNLVAAIGGDIELLSKSAYRGVDGGMLRITPKMRTK